MYHSVADVISDPWGLSVTPAHFAEHLEVLRAHGRALPLDQFSFGLENGHLPHDATIVTFDDGYADNLHNALPLLERFEIPATFFIATGYLGGQREFWWDELARVVFEGTVASDELRLTVGDKSFRWDLAVLSLPQASPQTSDRWRAWDPPPSADTHSIARCGNCCSRFVPMNWRTPLHTCANRSWRLPALSSRR